MSTTPDSNKGLAEKNYLPYPILSDSDREVIKIYGLETVDYEGQQRFMDVERSLFLLDRQGIIRYIWVSDNPDVEPNYEELKTALKQIPYNSI